jgi:predicted amidohydrolase
MRIGCVQLRAGPRVDDNIAEAGRLCALCARQGADLVVLPEKWAAFGPADALRAAAGPLDDSEPLRAAASWARELGVALVAGSVPETVPDADGKLANTSVAFDRDGRLAGAYRKLHLFDVDVDGRRIRESDAEVAGDEPVLAELDGITMGLAVCYDLRFPELFRAYADGGALVVTVPSAFLRRTGRDHWEVLVRARAIENGLFVAAPAQVGTLAGGYESHGHSLVCDPWGTVLADGGESPGVVMADCDLAAVQRVRRALPSLAHRRAEAYGRLPVPR